MRGSIRSSAYSARPVTLPIASTFGSGAPTTEKSLSLDICALSTNRRTTKDERRRISFLHWRSLVAGRWSLVGHDPPARGDHGLIDLGVASAAAQVAGQRLLDLVERRIGDLLEQRRARKQHARRAIAALCRAQLGEGLLQRMQLPCALQPLDCGDRALLHLDRQ